jgi:hypothetical protein
MNIKAITIAVILGMAACHPVYAQPGSGSCQQHPDAPYCQGGEGGGAGSTGGTGGSATVTGENTNDNTNVAGAVAGSTSGSNSDSSSTSSSGGNSLSNNVGIETGGADSSSTSSASGGQGGNASGGRGGDATSNVGDTTSNVGDTTATGGEAVAVGGKSEASSGGNSQDSEITVEGDTDNSVLIYEDEPTAASAASVFAGYCQTGASAQMQSGGFSVVNPELFCNHIRIAAVMQEAYIWEMKYGVAQCATAEDGIGEFSDVCMNETAQVYYKLYNENLMEANALLDNTQIVGTADAIAGYLIRPLAILALLLLL